MRAVLIARATKSGVRVGAVGVDPPDDALNAFASNRVKSGVAAAPGLELGFVRPR